MSLRSALVIAAIGFFSSAHGEQVADDFEGGANPHGWQWNHTGSVVADGGSPGAWFDSGTILVDDANLGAVPPPGSPLATALASGSLASVSFDFQHLRATCMPDGELGSFTLILTATHGTPDHDDDDYAYVIGVAVPDAFGIWTHVAFAIPSGAATLPPGWTGGYRGDFTHFRDGVTWPSLMQQLDEIDVSVALPFKLHSPGCYDVGVDSIVVAYGDGIFAGGFE